MVHASSIALGILCGPLVCVYVTFAACFCPSRLRQSGESDEKKRFERRQKMAPRPLVLHRQRALSIPLPDTECMNEGRKTLDQSQSRLMRLPLELREMIYRNVLGDNTLHMILKEQKLGHLRCKASNALECPLRYNGRTLGRESCWGPVDSANIWAPKSGINEPTDGNIIPFLRTCRQVYSEAINFLYSTNVFSFQDLDCLRHFSATVLPKRFNLVKKLDIEWYMTWPIYDPTAQQLLLNNPALYPPYDEATWEETWRIIANLPSLKFLRVSLLYYDGFQDPACEKKILAPLYKVTQAPVFEVRVSWDGREITGAPFRLIRPVPNDPTADDDSW
ncbi:hypothetical protein GQ43DRAFT_438617 [Delitschia confertaspora ATCC 74209]|uniref:DUF7730 domain-containing protein n=1 Tax=Delitschia confertaspora ATCC 74209 TaxID=1513339 RepID=A0A9P4JSQ5_9PLEO|nr:hypothetical protein GQ43DRAFT_438617 [Delitschia confertaspora ATCC 74209]